MKAKVKQGIRNRAGGVYKTVSTEDTTPKYQRRRLSSKWTNMKEVNKDLSRAEEVILSRWRTGVTDDMGTFRAVLKLDPTSNCRCCNLDTETVEHLFSDCTHHAVVAAREAAGFRDISVLLKEPKKALVFYGKLAEEFSWQAAGKFQRKRLRRS
jgi:hypothetical protein